MNTLPRHVAIVMDGNGRWARRRGLPRIVGHRAGAKAVKAITRCAVEKGIPVLTLFAFSSENWERPRQEVDSLMDLLLEALQQETPALHEHNVRLRFVGDRAPLRLDLQEGILASERLTKDNTAMTLVIATNYSGRWDILQAARQLAGQVAEQGLRPEAISYERFQSLLCLSDLPEPDLLIRTSGEQRLSNFMLWQIAYAELYFTQTRWPDFDRAEFEKALAAYAKRERRFGLTGEQPVRANSA